ncbi:MAG: hypothetical protein DCC71_11625 [Proteobacteria bacterium]|nr:MAG: hypothetical protein DCC71_11625 [Pseudomonadota bacterium]
MGLARAWAHVLIAALALAAAGPAALASDPADADDASLAAASALAPSSDAERGDDDASQPAFDDAPIQPEAIVLPKRAADAPPPRSGSRLVLPLRSVRTAPPQRAAAPPRCTDGVDVPPCRPVQRWCLAHATSTSDV